MAAMAEPTPETSQLRARLGRVIHRRWRQLLRWREMLHLSEETLHLVLASLVGIVGGLVNLVLRELNSLLQRFMLGQGGDLVTVAASLPLWMKIGAPAVGGLMAGLILYYGLRVMRLPGSTNLMEVVVVGDGRLSLRPSLVQSLSSLVTISTGGSIGREGPITQLSATLASRFGQLMKWHPYQLRLLVACGASAGMAAAYNAPVAGAVFAAQIVLGNFSMRLFAPLLVASVVATVVSRSFFGIAPWYEVPHAIEFQHLSQLPWFIPLGILAGAMGAMFLRLLRISEGLFNRLPVPLYWRMGLAGLVVGGLAAADMSFVWGNGYSVTNEILAGSFALKMLVFILLAKIVATLATVGSGAVGGVFTPTLFLGAGLGAILSQLLSLAHLGENLPPEAFVLAGMASVLAATTHSPLLAMIMVFEISGSYSLIPPLMIACAVSTVVSRRLNRESVYTEPLRRHGIELDRESALVGAATQQTVGDLMRAPVPPLNQRAPFSEIANRFLTSPYNYLPVVNDDSRLVGTVALEDLRPYLNAGEELKSVIAFDIMRPPPKCLTPDQRVIDAFPTLLASELRNVPVVNTPQEKRLIGRVIRSEALGLLSEAMATRRVSGDSPLPPATKG